MGDRFDQWLDEMDTSLVDGSVWTSSFFKNFLSTKDSRFLSNRLAMMVLICNAIERKFSTIDGRCNFQLLASLFEKGMNIMDEIFGKGARLDLKREFQNNAPRLIRNIIFKGMPGALLRYRIKVEKTQHPARIILAITNESMVIQIVNDFNDQFGKLGIDASLSELQAECLKYMGKQAQTPKSQILHDYRWMLKWIVGSDDAILCRRCLTVHSRSSDCAVLADNHSMAIYQVQVRSETPTVRPTSDKLSETSREIKAIKPSKDINTFNQGLLRCGFCRALFKDARSFSSHIAKEHAKPTQSLKTADERNEIPVIDPITEIFVNRDFIVDFEDATHIIAHDKELGRVIFASKTKNASQSSLTVHRSALNNYLLRLRIYWKKSILISTHQIIEREGSLTDYGWGAKIPETLRRSALAKKIAAEGVSSTLRSLQHLASQSRWGSPKSKMHYLFSILETDIDWVQKSYPQHEEDAEKSRLDHLLRKLWKLHPDLIRLRYPDKMCTIDLES